jgi:Nucleoside 2-deoxyribosyltransferase
VDPDIGAADMDDHRAHPDIVSALSSAKSVFAIVNGLTLTNTLLVLITGGHYSHVIPLDGLGTENIVFAVVLMANIVRFYHGNVRHLDTAYGTESLLRAASGRHVEPRGGLGVDFFIIFIQSLLFSATSFYINSHSTYISLFIALLTFDVVWTVYSQQPEGDLAASPQRMWLLNNIMALTALGVLFLIYSSRPHHKVWVLDTSVGVLAATTIIDFGLNWRFYFPRRLKKWHPGDSLKIFLSAPMTQYLISDASSEFDLFRNHWSLIASALEHSGHEVFSAHKREAWGDDLATPEAALKADVSDLLASELIIAYIGNPPSPGVQMELGYAIATHKRILVFTENQPNEPYLVRGLTGLPHAEVLDIAELGSIKPLLARKGLIDVIYQSL